MEQRQRASSVDTATSAKTDVTLGDGGSGVAETTTEVQRPESAAVGLQVDAVAGHTSTDEVSKPGRVVAGSTDQWRRPGEKTYNKSAGPTTLAAFRQLEPALAPDVVATLKLYRSGLRDFCRAQVVSSSPRDGTSSSKRSADKARGTVGAIPHPPPVPRPAQPDHAQAKKSLKTSTFTPRSSFLGLRVELQELLASFQRRLLSHEMDEAASPGGPGVASRPIPTDELLHTCFTLLGNVAGLQGLHPRAVRVVSICASVLWHAAYRQSNVKGLQGNTSAKPGEVSLASYMPSHRWHSCLQANVGELQAKLDELKRINFVLQSAIGRDTHDYHLALASAKALDRESEQLQARYDKLKAEKATAETELAQLTEEYNEEATDVRAARRKAEELERAIGKKQLLVRQLQDKVDKLQQQIDRHPVGKMADHKQAGAQTRNLVLSAEKELAKLQAALQKIKQDHEQKLHAHAVMLRQLDDLMQEERLARAEIALLKKERQRVRRTHTPRPDWSTLLGDLPVLEEQLPGVSSSHHNINGVMVPACGLKLAAKPKDTRESVDALKNLLVKGRRFAKNRAKDLLKARGKLEKVRQELKQAEGTLERLLAQKDSIAGRRTNGGHSPDFKLDEEPKSKRTKPGEYRIVKGLGMAPNIPPFLRHEGTLRVRIHRKPEVDSVVRDVWKLVADRQREGQSLQSVLSGYLKHRYGIHGLVIKAGYSLMYSLEQYFWDSDIELFALTLRGEMSLDVKKDQLEMIEGLQGFLKRVDLLDQGIVSNRIKASHVEQALTAFFPNKSKPRLRELVDAMLFDSKADEGVEDQKKRQGGEEDEEEEEEEESDEKYINCLSLFRESDQSSSRTLLILRQQHMAEVKQLVHKLQDAVRVVDPTDEGVVPVTLLPGLLRSMDPKIPVFMVNEYMARGLAVSQEELSKRMFHHERHHHHHPPTIAEGQVEAKGDDQADEVWRVDVHTFVSRLLSGLVKPYKNFVRDAMPNLDELKVEERKLAQESEELAKSFEGNSGSIRRAIGSLRGSRSSLHASESSVSLRRSPSASLAVAAAHRRLGHSPSMGSQFGSQSQLSSMSPGVVSDPNRPHVLSILMAASSPVRRRKPRSAVVTPVSTP